MTSPTQAPQRVTLPAMDLEFARALLVSARRDAGAMAQAYGITTSDKQRWVSMSESVRKLLAGLPAPTEAAADALEDVLG